MGNADIWKATNVILLHASRWSQDLILQSFQTKKNFAGSLVESGNEIEKVVAIV